VTQFVNRLGQSAPLEKGWLLGQAVKGLAQTRQRDESHPACQCGLTEDEVEARVDATIPFTILAFFPEYQMKDFESPSVVEMVEAYQRVKVTGLQHIRLGNVSVFARTEQEQRYLMAYVDRRAY
jgi:hypothetical protein